MSRSTRSAAAPNWTQLETLTLISEISAVQQDCRNSIASFQKFKMVSKNIEKTGVHRSLDQCRRKWASLMEGYNKVKELGSFWNLDDDIRAQIGVGDDFDLEVFTAMDHHLKQNDDVNDEARNNDSRSGGLVEYGEDGEDESGFEKQKNHPMVRRKRGVAEIDSKPHVLKEAAKKKAKPLLAPPVIPEEVDEEVNLLNEQKMLLATNQSYEEEEDELDKGQVLAEKLLENAKSVEATVRKKLNDNSNFVAADFRDAETDFIRKQGDELIAHLAELAETLKQFRDVVK